MNELEDDGLIGSETEHPCFDLLNSHDLGGKWVACAPTPYTLRDEFWDTAISEDDGSNLCEIEAWLLQHGIRTGIHENEDRLYLPTGERCRGVACDGFYDFWFVSETHRVLFEVSWRGRMRTFDGNRM